MGADDYLLLDTQEGQHSLVCSDFVYLLTITVLLHFYPSYYVITYSIYIIQQEEIVRVIHLIRNEKTRRLDGLKDLYRLHLDSLLSFNYYLHTIIHFLFSFLLQRSYISVRLRSWNSWFRTAFLILSLSFSQKREIQLFSYASLPRWHLSLLYLLSDCRMPFELCDFREYSSSPVDLERKNYRIYTPPS